MVDFNGCEISNCLVHLEVDKDILGRGFAFMCEIFERKKLSNL